MLRDISINCCRKFCLESDFLSGEFTDCKLTDITDVNSNHELVILESSGNIKIIKV